MVKPAVNDCARINARHPLEVIETASSIASAPGAAGIRAVAPWAATAPNTAPTAAERFRDCDRVNKLTVCR